MNEQLSELSPKTDSESEALNSLIKSLKDGDMEEFIDLAIEYCGNFKINNTWQGVDYDHSREEQIKGSKRKLAGFYPALSRLDIERWNIFANRIVSEEFHTVQSLIRIIRDVIENAHVRRNEWDTAAAVELPAFFDHLERLVSEDMNSEVIIHGVTSERISTIVSEFLTNHVGEGKNRVSRRGNTGLDGPELTCPIAHSKAKGVKYFAVVASEFLLMVAFGKQRIDLVIEALKKSKKIINQ